MKYIAYFETYDPELEACRYRFIFDNDYGASVIYWKIRNHFELYPLRVIDRNPIRVELDHDNEAFPDGPYYISTEGEVDESLDKIAALKNPTPLLTKIGFY